MVFGKIVEGMSLVRKIESMPTSSYDAPLVDIVVTNSHIEDIEPYETALEGVDNVEDFEEEDEDEDEDGEEEKE